MAVLSPAKVFLNIQMVDQQVTMVFQMLYPVNEKVKSGICTNVCAKSPAKSILGTLFKWDAEPGWGF